MSKPNPRTLILNALESGSRISVMNLLMGCSFSQHKLSKIGISVSVKALQKVHKHLQALVKNGRVVKNKPEQGVFPYRLRKRRINKWKV